MNLRLPAIAAIIAFVLTALFAIHPGPYQMALFVFVAQPLFVIALLGYAWRVVKDLRRKGVL
jgi:hypothetical protein